MPRFTPKTGPDENRRADGTAVSTSDKIEAQRGLTALRFCRSSLVTARMDAATAADVLHGARGRRAEELDERLADALAFCERLMFFTEGDLHA
jgi:hypothetical protein